MELNQFFKFHLPCYTIYEEPYYSDHEATLEPSLFTTKGFSTAAILGTALHKAQRAHSVNPDKDEKALGSVGRF